MNAAAEVIDLNAYRGPHVDDDDAPTTDRSPPGVDRPASASTPSTPVSSGRGGTLRYLGPIREAARRRAIRGTDRDILIAVADMFAPDREWAFLPLGELASRTGRARSIVTTHVHQLLARGALRCIGAWRPDGRGWGSVVGVERLESRGGHSRSGLARVVEIDLAALATLPALPRSAKGGDRRSAAYRSVRRGEVTDYRSGDVTEDRSSQVTDYRSGDVTDSRSRSASLIRLSYPPSVSAPIAGALPPEPPRGLGVVVVDRSAERAERSSEERAATAGEPPIVITPAVPPIAVPTAPAIAAAIAPTPPRARTRGRSTARVREAAPTGPLFDPGARTPTAPPTPNRAKEERAAYRGELGRAFQRGLTRPGDEYPRVYRGQDFTDLEAYVETYGRDTAGLALGRQESIVWLEREARRFSDFGASAKWDRRLAPGGRSTDGFLRWRTEGGSDVARPLTASRAPGSKYDNQRDLGGHVQKNSAMG